MFLAWSYDPVVGVRTAALLGLCAGGAGLYSGRVPFTFNNRYVGDITGVAAILLCLIGILLGAVMLVYPELFVQRFHPVIEYAPIRR